MMTYDLSYLVRELHVEMNNRDYDKCNGRNIYVRYKEVAEKKQWLMLSWCRVMDGF